MFSRIALASLVIFLVQPLTAHAQLLKNRKQKDKQPTVVHLHTTNVQPSYSPVVHPIYTPVIQPIVERIVAYPSATVTYPTVASMPLVLDTPVVTASAVRVEPAPVVNEIPRPAPKLAALRQAPSEIRLTNPRQTEGTMYFSFNNVTYALNPGETRTAMIDQEVVIKFDNGNHKQISYRLTGGAYEFTVSDHEGWDLVKRSSEAQTAVAELELQTAPPNSLPQRTTLNSLSSSSIPAL